VGASIFFSLVPNDCWVAAQSGNAPRIAMQSSTVAPSKIEGARDTLRSVRDDTQLAVGLLRELCEHRLVQPNPAFEIFEREIFVR
jgi:hypothetical protein